MFHMFKEKQPNFSERRSDFNIELKDLSPKPVPLESFFSKQNELISSLDTYIRNRTSEYLNSPSDQLAIIIQRCHELRDMLLNAFGQELGAIIDAHEGKYSDTEDAANLPNQFIMLCTNLREHFGNIRLYCKFKLFNDDFTVNTKVAMKIVDYAGLTAQKNKKSTDIFSNDNGATTTLSFIGADDIGKELGKLLDPFLAEIANDTKAIDTMLKQVNEWNAMPKLVELQKKHSHSDDKRSENYYKCALMQNYILNTLKENWMQKHRLV